MNKVLVTGSTGFVGKQTIPFLLEKGYEVHAVSTQMHPSNHPRLIRHQCNLFDADGTASLLREIQPSHLLHFAWIATPGIHTSSPENVTWMEASLRLVRLFVENGGKRVVAAGDDDGLPDAQQLL